MNVMCLLNWTIFSSKLCGPWSYCFPGTTITETCLLLGIGFSCEQKGDTGLLFLAHLNWKLMSCCLSFCLSENFSHFHLILQNHWANFSTKPGTKPPWVKDIQVKGHTLFDGEITLGNNKYRLTKSKNLLHFVLNFAEWTNPSSPFTTFSITPSFHFILGPSSLINTTSPIFIDCFLIQISYGIPAKMKDIFGPISSRAVRLICKYLLFCSRSLP